jgi:hypothetical protein
MVIHLAAFLIGETVLLPFAPGSLAQVLVEVRRRGAAVDRLASHLVATVAGAQGSLALDGIELTASVRHWVGAPLAACGDENRRAEERLRVHGDCLGMQNQPFEAIKREPHVHPVVSGR